MDDLLREFLAESAENVLRIEQDIVELEQRPEDGELLGGIFRAMHTIKGTCGFLGLCRLEQVAHAAENVLGGLREGALRPSQGVVSDVLAAVDAIKGILDGLERTQKEPAGDDAPLIERLDRWLGHRVDEGHGSLDALFHAERSVHAARRDGTFPATEAGSLPAATAPDADRSLPDPSEPMRPAGREKAESTLRVNVGVLDRIMNLAGELVLVRNRLMQLSQSEEDSAYAAPVQQLNRVTTDLQEAVMKTRMQPIGNAWGKLPRLVRDLAHAGDKEIDLVMVGADTELDRQILQAIRDPLTHMVRNSADHGIETPAERVAAGKPERGEVVLEAFHEGGHIVIEIRDDGRGLDVGAIRRKAVERGLVGGEEAGQLPDHRVFEFIFTPGFSTARKVTAVSGRGVGMDVVRRNIEQIGGTVEVRSTLGRGTVFRIKIPLTLAIMSALIVGSRSQSFALPQLGVVELVRVSGTDGGMVEDVKGTLFLRLRDELLPLVRLDRILRLGSGVDEGIGYVAVCQVGASRFGLIVDAILDTHEIVVKPVGRMIQSQRVYAGTTILGDGRVVMILDVQGIADAADVLTRSQEARAAVVGDGEEEATEQDVALLLFDAGVEVPRAVPLSQVSRLEEFSASEIEWAADRWVVQYRGKLLPLIPASEDVRMREVDPRPVVVLSDGVHALGLAVDRIRDIVQQAVTVEAHAQTPGLIGTALVAGRATELVDIDFHLAQARSEGLWNRQAPAPGSDPWLDSGGRNGHGSGHRGNDGRANGRGKGNAAASGETRLCPRILLVDDSPFFVNMLAPVLRAEGFDVAVSHDGAQALGRLERGEAFDALVTDINMPGMDGFELARRVRAAGRTELAVIALTSRYGEQDRLKGAALGFDRYLMKFDRGEVLAVVRETIAEKTGPEAMDEVPA